MSEPLPSSIYILFVLTTVLAAYFFYKATSLNAIMIIMIWMIIQGAVAMSGFYLNTERTPPLFMLLIVPPLIGILFLFATKQGRVLIDTCDGMWLTWFHSVRLPVELTLLGLYIYRLVPQLMTFEGVNFDIVTGITAPFIAYFGYMKKGLNRKVLIAWNIMGLALLFNVVIRAVLSIPTPFQKFAFDQPNTGVLYFPFVWLPCFIVPAALFAHLVCIRKLVK